MSNKGAIKKTPIARDAHKSNSTSKLKKKSSSNEDVESSRNSESKLAKRVLSLDHRGDGDRFARSMPKTNMTNAKEPVKSSSQSKSMRESSSSLKINTSISKSVTKIASTSKIKTDSAMKHAATSGSIPKNKTPVKNQDGYSEKRGHSTIYIPQSMASKLSSKSVVKNVQNITRDKEKVKNSSTLDRNKSKTLTRERKTSRTLSPSEVKVLYSANNKSQGVEESKKNQIETPATDEAYDYEDDFEDYESDFQDCTDSEASQVSEESSSSQNNLLQNPVELQTEQKRKTVNSNEHQKIEEEHMHDSGHFELTEARRRAMRMESIITNQSKPSALIELRQPVNKSYSEERPSENKSLPSSTDEGFEDSRSGDFPKSPPMSQMSFIDFPRTKHGKTAKKSKKTLSRGEELLEMIKLDIMDWSLLECSPVPYEEFIRSYGKLNTQQTSTQTGEDNIDMETQTDRITFKNKWTQFPVTCRTNLRSKDDLDLFRMDQVGVGGDDDAKFINSTLKPTFDLLRLSDFLNRAGRVMLSLLEERRFGGNVFKTEKQKLPFSDGAVKLCVDSVPFLAGRAVTIINYSEVLNKVLLTVHSPAEEEIETTNKQDYISDCCIGCVWNISEPSTPIKLFYSFCPITACSFHLTNYNVVFAGLQDGSISLWDLKEDEMWHQKITDKANQLDWTVRTPTYTTASSLETRTHNAQIVAIRILTKIEEKSNEKRNNRFVPIQICSLDEEGSLVTWSVLHNMGMNVNDLGLSYWGGIRLVKSQEVLLKSDIEKKKINAAAFVDMHVDCVDINDLYVATNTASVLHATCIGNRTNPSLYNKCDTNPCGNATCLEVCPFGRSFFLVGCDDGTIRLHSLNVEKPILQLKNEHHPNDVRAVQWSKSKPFTIYALDNNSCICIWNLSKSDINPSYTISMKEWGRVSSMRLSSCKTERDMAHQYLALGTESGKVEIHRIQSDFCYSKPEECLREFNMFMRYVAIL